MDISATPKGPPTKPNPSPFFSAPPTAEADNLAIFHLKRDALLPVKLLATADEGYAEGAVTNTRFGSFPHSTLIGVKWGSQVRASKVDTGTRGRKGKKGSGVEGVGVGVVAGAATVDEGKSKVIDEIDGISVVAAVDAAGDEAAGGKNGSKKRTSDAADLDDVATNPKRAKQEPLTSSPVPRPAIEAGSGFIHLLPPTPESWTSSLDHRTQVVYTPDYSYILSRLRCRPGSTIIEAGAGSGSFTHAAARAIFSGYPSPQPDNKAPTTPSEPSTGKVFSYEFHAPRVETLQAELSDHGLDGVVHLTHRDVCTSGFLLPPSQTTSAQTTTTTTPVSPQAQAIFLDLPAPWLALRHLTRHPSSSTSPLAPNSPVNLCTFSPCIEQVIATVSALRRSGWTEIEMLEVANRRLDVRREQIGLKNEGLRGVNSAAKDPDEAVRRLREVEGKMPYSHQAAAAAADAKTEAETAGDGQQSTTSRPTNGAGRRAKPPSKHQRLERIKQEATTRKVYKEGRLVHRTESEVKTHTSYLVFAVLPREWSEADEAAAARSWEVGEPMRTGVGFEREVRKKWGGRGEGKGGEGNGGEGKEEL